MTREEKESKKQEQKDAMVNIWMTDLNQTPEEKAKLEKELREKEEQRKRESEE